MGRPVVRYPLQIALDAVQGCDRAKGGIKKPCFSSLADRSVTRSSAPFRSMRWEGMVGRSPSNQMLLWEHAVIFGSRSV